MIANGEPGFHCEPIEKAIMDDELRMTKYLPPALSEAVQSYDRA